MRMRTCRSVTGLLLLLLADSASSEAGFEDELDEAVVVVDRTAVLVAGLDGGREEFGVRAPVLDAADTEGNCIEAFQPATMRSFSDPRTALTTSLAR